MTISTTTRRNDYLGTGTTGPYAYSFRIVAATDLVVTTRNLSNTEATLAYPADYSVSGVGDESGSITLTTALPSGFALTIRRLRPLLQTTDIRNQGVYFPEVHEDVFDNHTMVDQQQQDEIDRSLKYATTVDPTSVSADLPVPVALNVLGWNSVGTRIVNYALDVASMIAVPIGRLVSTVTQYLSNNAVFNVADYYSTAGVLPTNGTTSIAAALAAAKADAVAAGGGIIRLPYTPLGYNIGAASPGFLVPSNITLECPNGTLTLNYSGTGVAVDTLGSSYAVLRNLYVLCTNDAGSGVRWGGSTLAPSFWCRMENVTSQGTGTLTNTGTSFILDSGPHFCAYLKGWGYGLGHKYGVDVIGQVAGSHTWTTVELNLVLVGRSGGVVSGSRGVRTDANSNLQGSSLPGVVIEGYEQSYEYANGTPCFGFSMPNAGIEGNTSNYPTPPAGYAGEIRDFHGDYQYRQTCNGLANRWMQERIQTGTWLTESHYDRLHSIDDGSADQRVWGVQRGGSPIAGAFATDKFIVSTGAQGDVGEKWNWAKLLEYKTAFASAIPTTGAWGIGSVVFNSVPAAGAPVLWACTASGTLKSSPGNTASTTNGSPTVTLSALSTVERNDYITIAGAYATPTRIKSMSGLTLTMESNASGTVASVAVVFPAATFTVLVASKAAAVADVGALATIETAGGTYTSTEQDMLTHLKADVTSLRTTVNALLAARRTALEQA